MATAREIRRRIRSVKNVAQITRAVQMVASSKMRRAQDRVLAARPYSEELMKLVARLATEAASADDLPLMQSREVRSVAIVSCDARPWAGGCAPGNFNRRVGAACDRAAARDGHRRCRSRSSPLAAVDATSWRARSSASSPSSPTLATNQARPMCAPSRGP